MQRVPSSRGRQNSAQSLLQETRNRPSPSSSVRPTNGSNHSTTMDPDKTPTLTNRSVTDVKTSMKDTLSAKGEHTIEDDGTGDVEMRGGLVAGSKTNSDKPLKREDADTDSRSRPDRSRSISIATRGNSGNSTGGNGKVSKTSTPTQQTFSTEAPTRVRPARATEQPKRSHKKGAGLAAQLAAAQITRDEDGSSVPPEEDEDEDEDEDAEEPRYCYCNQVSYGEMVACDMEKCAREWFHLDCVGLSRAPTKNGEFWPPLAFFPRGKGNEEEVFADEGRTARWFCDECKENLKKGKVGNGGSR